MARKESVAFGKANTRNGASIEKIKNLYNRAVEHSLYFDEANQESRSFEAFLMLIPLMERVLTSFGQSSLEKRKNPIEPSKKCKDPNNRYSIGKAIKDLHSLKEISAAEYNLLKSFQEDRNDYIHDVFSKKDSEIEKIAHELFEKHRRTFVLMLEKLEKSLSAQFSLFYISHALYPHETTCNMIGHDATIQATL